MKMRPLFFRRCFPVARFDFRLRDARLEVRSTHKKRAITTVGEGARDGRATKKREEHEEKETGRLEAFSDGVFAIAVTLLVLELKVPDLAATGGSPDALAKALLQQWPSYVALVTSFFTVLIMWVHHQAILRNVCRTDGWLHFANGCLLLEVTFVSNFDPCKLSSHSGGKNGRCLLRRHVRIYGHLLLSVHSRGVP
jgi:Endosomal/lysosomal potassium channel TMEM175